MSDDLELRIKIGEIEFYAKGEPKDVEAQRHSFISCVLPTAVQVLEEAKTMRLPIEKNGETDPALRYDQDIIELQTNAVLNQSVNEFLKEKSWSSNIDYSIGLIYYNYKNKGQKSFTSSELKGFFQDARITPPKNPSDVILKLIKKSYVMQSEDNRHYCITQTGIDYVENPNAETRKARKKSSKGKANNSKRVSSFSSYSADDLSLNNYPSVDGFSSFKEKMMLSLYIVYNEKLGESFSVFDVRTIMEDLIGVKATKGQIQGVFDRNKTWFKTENDTDNNKSVKHKLLNAGIDFGRSLLSKNT